MYRVLFVCTGNTCRSPMAEAFFNMLAGRRGLAACALSAGLNVTEEEASGGAVKAAAEYGADLSRHRPRPLTQDLIDVADLILTMTAEQKELLETAFPSAKGKSWTLLSFIGKRGDIDDPFGGSLEDYRRCARYIWLAVKALVARLGKNMGPQGHPEA